MKSGIVKRSIVISGHKTSVSLEDDFWTALKEIAKTRNVRLSDLVTGIDGGRQQGNLSSALRLFVLNHFQSLNAEASATGLPADDNTAQPGTTGSAATAD
jgi:predicted DNA-binding ribbon-helix-helix protein